MSNKEEFYKYGKSLGIKINDLQRLKMLACESKEPVYEVKTGKEIIDFANKCLHEMNFGELTTTECIAKYLDLWHKHQVSQITSSDPKEDMSSILRGLLDKLTLKTYSSMTSFANYSSMNGISREWIMKCVYDSLFEASQFRKEVKVPNITDDEIEKEVWKIITLLLSKEINKRTSISMLTWFIASLSKREAKMPSDAKEKITKIITQFMCEAPTHPSVCADKIISSLNETKKPDAIPKWKICKNCDCGEFPVRRCDCGCHD